MKRQYRFNKKEKQILFLMLHAAMDEYDKRPEDVVNESYNGDENAYLTQMVKWHNIPREKIRKLAKKWLG